MSRLELEPVLPLGIVEIREETRERAAPIMKHLTDT